MNEPCRSNTPTTSNVCGPILIRCPSGESAPNRSDETVVPDDTHTGRPPDASAAEKKCPRNPDTCRGQILLGVPTTLTPGTASLKFNFRPPLRHRRTEDDIRNNQPPWWRR